MSIYSVGKIIIWSPADFVSKKKSVYHFYGMFILTDRDRISN